MQDVKNGETVWGVISRNGLGIWNSMHYVQLLCKSKYIYIYY